MRRIACSFLFLLLLSASPSASADGMNTGAVHPQRPMDLALPQLGGTTDDWVGNWNKKTHLFRLTDRLNFGKTAGSGLPFRGNSLQYRMENNDMVWVGFLKGSMTDGKKAPVIMWKHEF